MKKMTEEIARRIKESEDWGLICQELDYRIDCEMKHLLSVQKEDLEKCQTRIQEMQRFKTLPQDVIDREEAA